MALLLEYGDVCQSIVKTLLTPTQPKYQVVLGWCMATEILIVDDDSATLSALPDTLRLKLPSVRVETCSTAGAALQRLCQKRYDLIITDWRMPGMNGLALLREARKITATPFIMITGHADLGLLRLAQQAGAFEVLSKPLDRRLLLDAVKRALAVRQRSGEVATS
jgi:DNA-binding NtrC family response regulator